MSEMTDTLRLLQLADRIAAGFSTRIIHTRDEAAAELRRIADELDAFEQYAATGSLSLARRHVHECGTCGQLRECHHAQCEFNVLADCDPGFGCRTPKPAADAHLGAIEP